MHERLVSRCDHALQMNPRFNGKSFLNTLGHGQHRWVLAMLETQNPFHRNDIFHGNTSRDWLARDNPGAYADIVPAGLWRPWRPLNTRDGVLRRYESRVLLIRGSAEERGDAEINLGSTIGPT